MRAERVKRGRYGEHICMCVVGQQATWSLKKWQPMSSRLQNVKAHEGGKKHKEHAAAWQQAQKDKASWQQRMDKGTEYTPQMHKGQAQLTPTCTVCLQAEKNGKLGSTVRGRSRAKSSAIAKFSYPAAIGKWLEASKHGSFGQE
eukprot:1138995-Pelagomonas_calceolata.AAC.4